MTYIVIPKPTFPAEEVVGPNNPLPVTGSVSVTGTSVVTVGNFPSTYTVTAPQASPLYVERPDSSTSKDAFGRERVSLPQVLSFGQFEYGFNSAFYESQVVGTGVTASVTWESSLSLSTGGTASGALARIQTRAFARYVPGRSQLIRFTGSFGTPIANVRQRCGKFCNTDGIFMEYDGTTLYFVRRTSTSGSVVDNRIARSSWSDKFDGTGPSGANIDFANAKTWLCWVDLEWLGVGRYRFGFASTLTGALKVAYEGAGTGTLAVPYMRTANLPTRYEIENTGTAAASTTLKWICHSDDTEGGDEGEIPLQFPVDSGVTAQSLASGTFKPVLALRARTTGPNGVPNRGQIVLKDYAAAVSGNTLSAFRLVLNPTTLTQAGAAVTWVQASSLADYAVFTNANDTISGGTNVGSSFYVPATANLKGSADASLFRKFPLVYTELGSVQDVIVLAGAGVGGNSAALGAMTYQELF